MNKEIFLDLLYILMMRLLDESGKFNYPKKLHSFDIRGNNLKIEFDFDRYHVELRAQDNASFYYLRDTLPSFFNSILKTIPNIRDSAK